MGDRLPPPARRTGKTGLAEAALRMREALAATGVSVKDVRTPNLTRLAWDDDATDLPGAPWWRTPPPTTAPSDPDVTHSAELGAEVSELKPSREPSPEERRDAWLNLVTSLEGWLLAFEQRADQAAHLLTVLEADVPGYIPHGDKPRAVEAQKARAWAARRLVEQVRQWHAPEVPRDDEKGQGSILELFPGAESTAVENPVEEVRVVHWVGEETGAMLHALPDGLSAAHEASGDEDDVTCRACLQALHENRQGH